ncbi:MAG: NIL domain-containing protein [Planctomycetota bacterium]
MASKKYVLKFPARLVERPIASELVSEHGLVVNILRARVEPDEEGMLVVELTGEAQNIEAGLAHVKELGVEVEPLAKDITWREDLCTDCTACRSVCPTEALSVTDPDMEVRFEADKCIACELCIPACPYGAVEITF